LIVGLGNPGEQYQSTRHNVGFLAIDQLGKAHEIATKRLEKRAFVGYGSITEVPVGLVKPQTFMNLSGESVAPLMRGHQLTPDQIIIITDDLDLPLGKIRIRRSGSPGGHNGLKSLVHELGTEEFLRIRIGIGRPAPGTTVIDHVLSDFAPSETKAIEEAINRAKEAAGVIVTAGVAEAMQRFNGS
jgi:PTH1 family peptidyl-tRNA hydrolase